MKKRLIIILCAALLLTISQAAYAEELIYYGSSDTETVRQIQQKLKNWGYYEGRVDGEYGWMTEEAIKWFQSKNGLKADGKVGKLTLQALGIYKKGSSSGQSSGGSSDGSYSNDSDVMLLARCINGEARGEEYTGQVAVAAVILNRVEDPGFPNSISGVVYQSGAFDAVADGQINLEPYDSCVRAAKDALAGWDPTGGAIYYYNPETATNQWIRTREIITTIGKHVFCK